MKRWLKHWKPIAIGIGLLYLLVLARCHLIAPPMRLADVVMEMKTTGYCACKKCCSWKISWYGMPVFSSGPLKGRIKIIGQTASARMARPGTVAVDPKLFPMGTKFYIPGYGWGIGRARSFLLASPVRKQLGCADQKSQSLVSERLILPRSREPKCRRAVLSAFHSGSVMRWGHRIYARKTPAR